MLLSYHGVILAIRKQHSVYSICRMQRAPDVFLLKSKLYTIETLTEFSCSPTNTSAQQKQARLQALAQQTLLASEQSALVTGHETLN